MTLKNSNPVGLERRMDLASLFCMIGRHGPAVALAVIVLVSVLAGFIIYRSVRGKRRKATGERDALVVQPSLGTVASTDLSDEDSSAVQQEEADHLQIRRRHAAAAAAAAAAVTAERTSPFWSAPKSDTQVSDNKHTPPNKTEQAPLVMDKVAEMYSEEASQRLQTDTDSSDEVEVEDMVGFQQDAADDTLRDVEEINDNDSVLMGPELSIDECLLEREEKEFKAENQEDTDVTSDTDVTTDKDFSDKKPDEEEESFQNLSSDPESFEESLPISERESGESLKDLPATCNAGTDERHYADRTDDSQYPSNNHITLEEGVKNEEVEVVSSACSLITQQAEIFEEETNPPSSQQDHCDEVTDMVASPVQESRWDDHHDSGETVGAEPSNNAADAQSPFDREELQIEDSSRTRNQELDVLNVGDDQVISDNTGAPDEEHRTLSPVLMEDNEISDDGLSGITPDATAQDTASIPDMSLDSEQGQKDLITDASAEEDFAHLDPQLPSDDATNMDKKDEDHTCDPPSSCKEDAYDDASAAACPDTSINVAISIIAEEISRSVLSTICQARQSDDAGEETRVNSSGDEATGVSHGDISSSLQDQRVDLNNAGFSEVASIAAPLVTEDPSMCHLLTFEQSGLTENESADMEMSPSQDSHCEDDGGQADEAAEEDILKEDSKKFDAQSPQFDEQELQMEQKEDCGVTCSQAVGVVPAEADQGNIDNHDSSERVISHLSHVEPGKADDDDASLSIITHDATAQVLGIADIPGMSLDSEQAERVEEVATSAGEDFDSACLHPLISSQETANRPDSDDPTTTLDDPLSYKDQQSTQKEDNGAFDEGNIAACPYTVSLISEELAHSLPTICKAQQSNYMDKNDTFEETGVHSATDSVAGDDVYLAVPVTSEEIFHSDDLTSSQDQPIHQTKEVIDEAATSATPVLTEDIAPPMCHILLPAFEQSELRDSEISSPCVGEESGISSMAVSPDLQDPCNEFDMSVDNTELPMRYSDPQLESKIHLYADDAPVSVTDSSAVLFGLHTHEDMFGHEVEDSYHRDMDKFMVQIETGVTRLTDERQTDGKAVVEVVGMKERKRVSAEKKKDTEAEQEKDDDHERTEISIMEATMDNNEWITDTNYQFLPWMNLSVPSSVRDHAKSSQLPTEACHHSSSLPDAACPDTSPSLEVKPTSAPSLVDENTESNKKVVAVQPMPQNVSVTFRIHYLTHSPYQTVAITGNQEELGNWKEYISLEGTSDGHWVTVVSLPAESHVEWKFVVLDKGEVCRWEECGNRFLDTGYGDDLLVHKWWGFR